MATQTEVISMVRDEEKDMSNLASMLDQFNEKMTSLQQKDNTETPSTTEDYWAVFRWVVEQLADLAQFAGTATSVFKAAKAVTRNSANVEALLKHILRAVGGLESFFLGSYKISRRMFARGHLVRRWLQKIWFYFRDAAPTAQTADKILGGLQILGAVVGLAMAVKTLVRIRKLNEAIQQSETELREWEEKWIQLLTARRETAEDAVSGLMEYFDSASDLTDQQTQVTLHRHMRNAQHRLEQYKTKISSATAELRQIKDDAREHRVKARANARDSTSAIIGGVGTVAAAAMGPAGTVAKVVVGLGVTTTAVGVVGLSLSTRQLGKIGSLLQRVGKNMDMLNEHSELYDDIVGRLEDFAQDFENKINETKSSMARLREAEQAQKDQLAAQQAELEAMRRLIAQMNVVPAANSGA